MLERYRPVVDNDTYNWDTDLSLQLNGVNSHECQSTSIRFRIRGHGRYLDHRPRRSVDLEGRSGY